MNTMLPMFQITIQSHLYAKHVFPIPNPSLNLIFVVLAYCECHAVDSRFISIKKMDVCDVLRGKTNKQ